MPTRPESEAVMTRAEDFSPEQTEALAEAYALLQRHEMKRRAREAEERRCRAECTKQPADQSDPDESSE